MTVPSIRSGWRTLLVAPENPRGELSDPSYMNRLIPILRDVFRKLPDYRSLPLYDVIDHQRTPHELALLITLSHEIGGKVDSDVRDNLSGRFIDSLFVMYEDPKEYIDVDFSLVEDEEFSKIDVSAYFMKPITDSLGVPYKEVLDGCIPFFDKPFSFPDGMPPVVVKRWCHLFAMLVRKMGGERSITRLLTRIGGQHRTEALAVLVPLFSKQINDEQQRVALSGRRISVSRLQIMHDFSLHDPDYHKDPDALCRAPFEPILGPEAIYIPIVDLARRIFSLYGLHKEKAVFFVRLSMESSLQILKDQPLWVLYDKAEGPGESKIKQLLKAIGIEGDPKSDPLAFARRLPKPTPPWVMQLLHFTETL